MRIYSLRLACAAASISAALAQQPLTPEPVPGPARNAGIYHVNTGTWTRSTGGAAQLGPDTVYQNTVDSGYFSTLGMAGATTDYSLIDNGRLPSANSSIPAADRDTYCINGITFCYCSDIAGPNVAITFCFYDSYMPCDLVITNPTAPFNVAGCVSATGLPGGTTAGAACWIVTLDLEGGGEISMEADGGPAFPGEDLDINTDAFGAEWVFNGAFGSSTGPMLSGDPDWTTSTVGALFWGGGGTYYDAATTCADTGLDTQDFFAVDEATAPLAPGCYFFGGYKNTNGCGGPSNSPMGSFSLCLYADLATAGCTSGITTFCEPAGINSSGTAVDLDVITGTGIGADVRLEAAGGPPGFFGYFLVSAGDTASISLGDGTLCLTGPQGRYNPAAGGALNSTGQFDAAGVLQNVVGTSTTGEGFDLPIALPSPPGGSIMAGDTWHFQLWYRDANPTSTVNFSNGVSLTF